MRDTKIRTFARFLLVLLDELHGITSGTEVLMLAEDLQRQARVIGRFERAHLSRDTSQGQRAARAEARVAKLARMYNLTIRTNGDPLLFGTVVLRLKSHQDWHVPE